MGFSQQEYWSGLTFPPRGDLPNLGIKSPSPVAPAVAGRLTTWKLLPKLWNPPKKGPLHPKKKRNHSKMARVELTPLTHPGLLATVQHFSSTPASGPLHMHLCCQGPAPGLGTLLRCHPGRGLQLLLHTPAIILLCTKAMGIACCALTETTVQGLSPPTKWGLHEGGTLGSLLRPQHPVVVQRYLWTGWMNFVRKE